MTHPRTPQREENPPTHDLDWFEIHFAREVAASEVAQALRPLAYRPVIGWRRRTPVVVFELQASRGAIRWLVGIDHQIGEELPRQFQAQLDGLVLVPLAEPPRSVPLLAATITPFGLSQLLRVELMSSVTAGVLEVMDALDEHESAVIQWVIGPAQSRGKKPETFSVARALGLVASTTMTPEEQRGWRQKAAEPLFAVRGRIGARSPVPGQTGAILRTLGEALRLVIHAGQSVFVLDPRGDLIDAILAGVPAVRRKDVVIIDPGSADKVVGFNPLAGSRETAEQRAVYLRAL